MLFVWHYLMLLILNHIPFEYSCDLLFQLIALVDERIDVPVVQLSHDLTFIQLGFQSGVLDWNDVGVE